MKRLFAFSSLLVNFAGLAANCHANAEELRPYDPIYRSERIGNILKIDYSMPYVRALEGGAIMRPMRIEHKEGRDIVSLDIKINNPTNKGLLADSVDFDVTESLLVNDVIPYVAGFEPRSIAFSSLGWAEVARGNVSYKIVSQQACTTDIQVPMSSRTVEPVRTVVGNWPFLVVRLAEKEFPRLAGKARLQAGDICVVGRLSYSIGEARIERSFATDLAPSSVKDVSSLSATAKYNLFLEAGKSNYRQTLPISQFIAPASPDRFIIRFRSNQSASFKFKVSTRLTDGTVLALGSIDLNYFRLRYR